MSLPKLNHIVGGAKEGMISVGVRYDARRNPFRPRRSGGSRGRPPRKRERSRARRTSTPARSRPVVSLGRSTTAESRGRRWTRENETRGRQTLAPGRGGRPGQRLRTDTRTRRVGGKRRRLSVGKSLFRQCRTLFPRNRTETESLSVSLGPTTWPPRREGARAEPHALFRAHCQYARRARSVRYRVRVVVSPQSVYVTLALRKIENRVFNL